MLVFWFIITLLVLYLWKDSRKPVNFPPGPKWIPIIGCIPLIKNSMNKLKFHHLMWENFSLKYGSISGFRIGRDKLIVISGIDAIKKFYQNDEFNARPNGFFYRIRTFNKSLGIVFNDGENWEIYRKFSMKTLKQLRIINANHNHIEKEANEMIEYFKSESKSGKLFDMQHLFDIAVLNVIWSLLAGYRFNPEDEECLKLLKLIHESFRVIDMSGGILNQFPFIRYIFPVKSGYNRLIETSKPLWKFLLEKINEIKLNLNDEPKCFIETFILNQNELIGEKFSIEQLLSICIDFFQAGSETTSNTLSFGLIFMLNYPNVLKKCQKELDKTIGKNNLPKLKDKINLPYVEAVISEIQRFANVAPLGIAHRALSNCKFSGYNIPKNSIALVSLYSLNMDKNYWKDPQKFRPERFIDDITGKYLQHDNFIPFGLGKRRCIGESLAKSSLFLFFASFIHKFDIELINDILPDMEGINGITLSPKPYSAYLKYRH